MKPSRTRVRRVANRKLSLCVKVTCLLSRQFPERFENSPSQLPVTAVRRFAREKRASSSSSHSRERLSLNAVLPAIRSGISGEERSGQEETESAVVDGRTGGRTFDIDPSSSATPLSPAISLPLHFNPPARQVVLYKSSYYIVSWFASYVSELVRSSYFTWRDVYRNGRLISTWVEFWFAPRWLNGREPGVFRV